MNVEAHLACGWALANLMPAYTRIERFAVVSTALVSDADGLSYLFGADAYANWHHTAGHTLFLVPPLILAGTFLARRGRRLSLVLALMIAFASHLVGDYFLSGWGLELLWPLDAWAVRFYPRIGLDHPINVWLSYASSYSLALRSGGSAGRRSNSCGPNWIVCWRVSWQINPASVTGVAEEPVSGAIPAGSRSAYATRSSRATVDSCAGNVP